MRLGNIDRVIVTALLSLAIITPLTANADDDKRPVVDKVKGSLSVLVLGSGRAPTPTAARVRAT